jgi:hypothetical protein
MQNRKNYYQRNCAGCNWSGLVRPKTGFDLLAAVYAAGLADGAVGARRCAVVARYDAIQLGVILGSGRRDQASDGDEEQTVRAGHFNRRKEAVLDQWFVQLGSIQQQRPRPLPIKRRLPTEMRAVLANSGHGMHKMRQVLGMNFQNIMRGACQRGAVNQHGNTVMRPAALRANR